MMMNKLFPPANLHVFKNVIKVDTHLVFKFQAYWFFDVLPFKFSCVLGQGIE